MNNVHITRIITGTSGVFQYKRGHMEEKLVVNHIKL